MSNIARLTKQISKHLIAFAEVAVWLIVSVAVYKLFLNGVASISSMLAALFLSAIVTAGVFYAISLYTKERDKDAK